MLLIFNHTVTTTEKETNHGAPTPPSMVHFAIEIEPEEYRKAKNLLAKYNIQLEKENSLEKSVQV